MVNRLTREDIQRIATLARLELSDEEIARYTPQLAAILAYAEQVQELDTTQVPPTSHVLSHASVDRADETRPGLDRDAVLAGAPDAAVGAGLFRVPKVIGA